MRIVFVNRFYWPEEPATAQLLADLAEALAAAGHDVSVVTTRPAGSRLPAHEIHHGVTIRRAAATRWARAGIVGKALDYLVSYATTVGTLLAWSRRDTIVIPMTDPPLLGIGVWLAARLRGARVVQWVQDVYPEVAIALSGQCWLSAFRPFRNLAWRRADACVAVGTDIAALLQRGGVSPERVHVIHNPAPAGIAPWRSDTPPALRAEWGLQERFVVAYSGNLGRVHELDPVLEAAARLREDRRIVFLFIGDGPQRARLESTAHAMSLANVLFRPPQPRARLNESMAVADAHLVTLRAGCEQFVFPSKLHGIVAAGLPILFVGPSNSEPARLVRDRHLGFAFAREDAAALADAVRRIAADARECARLAACVRAFAVQQTAEAWARHWNTVLTRVAAGGERRCSPTKRLA